MIVLIIRYIHVLYKLISEDYCPILIIYSEKSLKVRYYSANYQYYMNLNLIFTLNSDYPQIINYQYNIKAVNIR